MNILKFSQFLTILNVKGNFIGNKGVNSICMGLKNGPNQALLSLNLSNNNISAVGAEYLLQAIPKTKLKTLDISRNPLENKGA